MTVNQYLMFANNKLQEDAENNRRNYGECEIVSYITDVKIKLPDGNIRTYHSEYPND
mgnify:CR=1 FL=1